MVVLVKSGCQSDSIALKTLYSRGGKEEMVTEKFTSLDAFIARYLVLVHYFEFVIKK